MTELQRLIREQKADMKCYTINPLKENETLIRPHIYRFKDFPGETPKQKAFAILKYLGWKSHAILSALNLSVIDLCEMQDMLQTTVKEELGDKFFTEIPLSIPRHKAIIILKALGWSYKETALAVGMSTHSFTNMRRIIKQFCKINKLAEKRLYNPRT